MIQAILIQTLQGAAVETANAPKTAGQSASGFASLLQVAAQAMSGATAADIQTASKADTLPQTAAEPAAELNIAPTLSQASKAASDASLAASLLPAAADATDDSTLQDEGQPAHSEEADESPAAALEGNPEAGVTWLPAALTAAVQNTAPLPKTTTKENASAPSNTAAATGTVTAANTVTAPSMEAVQGATTKQGETLLPSKSTLPGKASTQDAQPADPLVQPAAQPLEWTSAAPVAATSQANLPVTESAPTGVPAETVAAVPQTADGHRLNIQPNSVQPESQPTAPTSSQALKTQPLQTTAPQAAAPETAVAQPPADILAQMVTSTEPVEASNSTLQSAAVKAYAANVAAASLAATPDAEPEAPRQPAQQSTTTAALGNDPAQVSVVQPQSNGSATNFTTAQDYQAQTALSKDDMARAQTAKSVAQRQVESSGQKVSGAETARPAASRSTILPQGATDPFVDTLLRADLNTGANPLQAGAMLTGASNATILPGDQSLVRQALLNQTRQGIETSLQSGKTSLRLRLVPGDLGGIDLRVTTGPQGASVLIRAENPATGRLLEQNLGDLRSALQDAGVQLNNLSVGQQGAQSGQFSGQHAPSQHGLPNAFQRHASAHPAVANAEDADGNALHRNGATSQVNYLV